MGIAHTGAFAELYLRDLPEGVSRPSVDLTRYLVNGEIRSWSGHAETIYSPVLDDKGQKVAIGRYAMLGEKEAMDALHAARAAYGDGNGTWPRMSTLERIQCVLKYVEGLKASKAAVVNLLMWEICKSKADATKEVDRTIDYINDTIKELKAQENGASSFVVDSGIIAQVRRVPLGAVLCVGPFNYPFNETYTNLIPALLMGNTVVLKTPRTGCLCHAPTLELFRECFPPGVVNVVHGAGRETLPPLMKSGLVDVFAFIGTSKAAVELQRLHPHPNRLRVCLALDAKNPAIVCADADLDVAVSECVLGSLSFNGQRCTALKIIHVHESIADRFVERMAAAVDALKIGLPWAPGVSITPLPEPGKPAYIAELIADAVVKGARVVNERGGRADKSIVAPTLLYPVTPAMRVYQEEQFGPVVPIAPFSDMDQICDAVSKSSFGQQASIFSTSASVVSTLLDRFVSQVSRVNVNAQCQRGPDILPFTGRKNSAYGTLSVKDALRIFSIRSVMATKDTAANKQLFSEVMNAHQSKYLHSSFMF